ncbi:DUF2065 domain-containing protein [Limnohabitans sp. Rim8]|jgi:uncharacterized protein YjeT (DUF2065 family)|uniref:DUF2065 domain-containing protein n=1 Tax=Limnohabitans curvus TaxID=323423 RepID=A0A315ETE4_9BURK|nr:MULTISPECIES: DUF2065 domain-containing protein [Limnohabitans]PUE60529.1 DUF2065 domain-containing protein [Limnohabitans curvus]PUE61052.1 DUF2065 domain-containing protein [Limnohabitans sp. Rim8]
MSFDSDTLWVAFGLMLIFEGIFPFVSPHGWRDKMAQLMVLEDGQIRFFGLVCVVVGLLMLWWLG